MSDDNSPSRGGNDPLRVLAEALAPYLRKLLGRADDNPQPVFYSQNDSPLGRRRHLELVRRGLLTGRKVRRLVLVPRDEVHAFIERHGPALAVVANDNDNDLAEWGLLPRRGKR
jgi:hypothetical protein